MTSTSWILLALPAFSASFTGYRGTLATVRRGLGEEKWTEAGAMFVGAGPIGGNDPGFFNLVGVLREVEGNKSTAAEFYGRAIRADANYAPAQQNMRRLYELRNFGQTHQVVALGDEL